MAETSSPYWVKIATPARATLADAGYGDDAIAWILDRLERAFSAIGLHGPCSISIPARNLAEVERAIQVETDRMQLALAEIFSLATELYVTKFPAPSPGVRPRLRLVSNAVFQQKGS